MIGQINLQEELAKQFQATTKLLQEAYEEDAEYNHQATLINAATALLRQIADAQQKLYTASRLQKIEQVLAEVLQTLPEKQQEEFMLRYEELLCLE